MNAKEIVQSKKFKVLVALCGVSLVALLSFASGVVVGLHKARFSYRFGENYERNFATNFGPGMGRTGGMMSFGNNGFRNSHGIVGEILSVSGESLLIKDRNNQESTIRVSGLTVINSGQDTVDITQLKTGDQVAVVGRPGEDGVIDARLIRIFVVNAK